MATAAKAVKQTKDSKDPSKPEILTLEEGINKFSVDLYREIKKESSNSIICSPFSITVVVGMAKLGAKGDTALEIQKTFNFPADDITLRNGYAKILSYLQSQVGQDNFTLAVANKIYTATGCTLKQDYANYIKTDFKAEVEQLDFGKATAAAATINSWIEKTTQNKIHDLISADSINAETRAVLVNGIYFKGLWETKFSVANTKKAPFYLTSKGEDSVVVDMMTVKGHFYFRTFDALNATAIMLHYKGCMLSMVVILPNKKGDLTQLENGLKDLSPSKILGNMESCEVKLSLPRFKLESTFHMIPYLNKLGMKAMFGANTADFTGISETKDQLFVSEIIQKAFIEVNEEGSEAAAATGMIGMSRSMPPPPEQFIADHPFFFQIIDRENKLIVFMGCCKNPLSVA